MARDLHDMVGHNVTSIVMRAERDAPRWCRSGASRVPALTERERAVLAAVCAGDSNAAIAGALGVSNRIQLAIRGSSLGLDAT